MERKKINRLKVAFAERDMTNKHQAKILDRNPTITSKLVNAAQPGIETFILLVKVLKMKVDDLPRTEQHAK